MDGGTANATSKKFDTKQSLKETTIADLGPYKYDSVTMLLAFRYEKPDIDEKTGQKMISRLKEKIFQKNTPHTPQNASSIASSSDSSSNIPTSPATPSVPSSNNKGTTTVEELRRLLPSHRFRRLLGRLPKQLKEESSSAHPETSRDSSSGETQHRSGVSTAKTEKNPETAEEDYDVRENDFASLVSAVRGARQQSSKSFSQFKTTMLRIRFPGRLILEAKFLPEETVADVTEFVRASLKDEKMPFILFTAPPRRVLTPADKEKSLASLRLVPSAIIHFSSELIDPISGKPTKKGGGSHGRNTAGGDGGDAKAAGDSNTDDDDDDGNRQQRTNQHGYDGPGWYFKSSILQQ
mmetsp:Transcript_23037/g.37006  ORF Transcript_23037/g.37006 Transcript_23037/m.37006 type:complete len:351 (+) Transcript_23037:307-1359(+)